MEPLLNADEKSQLTALAMNDSSISIRRRAQLLLLYADGLQTGEVARRVGLSASQTRHWRGRFRANRMEIFANLLHRPPEASEPVQAEPEHTSPDLSAQPAGKEEEFILGSAEEAGEKSVTLEEIHLRYPPNLQRVEHRRDLALALFDATQPIHQLPEDHRWLLETAALLGYLVEAHQETDSAKAGYMFVLSHPLANLNESGQETVELILKYQGGKISRRAYADFNGGIQPQREALILAALLRIALGLDQSGRQETQIEAVEPGSHALHILVTGPYATSDARAAQKQARLWAELFQQGVSVRVAHLGEAGLDAEKLESLMSMQSPGIKPDDPLAEAGRKAMSYNFAEMLRHEAGTSLGEDIEALHDMRVATRRMRAAFEVFADGFEPKRIKVHLKGLRATGRALGRVRDLDVFMEKAGRYLETLPEDHRAGLDPLLEAWRGEREADRAVMLEHLNGEGYANFKRKFLAFLATPGAGARRLSRAVPTPNLVRHVLPALIYTRLAAVRAYEPILDTASLEQLHGLRIEFKQLRYTLEFFSEVLGEEAQEIIAIIKGLQDHLGDLNDADVACQLLRTFLDEWDTRQAGLPVEERQNPEPVVAYLAAKHAERHHLMITFRKAWQGFDRPELRAKLASAVSVL